MLSISGTQHFSKSTPTRKLKMYANTCQHHELEIASGSTTSLRKERSDGWIKRSSSIAAIFAFVLLFLATTASASGSFDSLEFTSKIAANGKCMQPDVSLPTQQLQVTDCDNSENQEWTYERSTGLIRSRVSNKCLDAYFIAYMFTCHGGMNQQWDLLPSGEIKVRVDGKCLDVAAPSSSIAMVNMASCNGTTNQRWESVSQLGLLANGSTVKCLDVDTASLDVQTWACLVDSDSQQWSYNQATAQIRSAGFAGKCLYAPENSQSVRMSHCSDDPSQQWDSTVAQGIRNRGRNQCLDLLDLNPVNGAEVVARTCNGLSNQRWHMLY
jgi:Ricin-type beta-trefoil lectin domain